MRYLSSVVLGVALGAVGACGSKDPAPPAPTAGSGSAVVQVAESPVLEIFVNDASVAKVTAAQLAGWPRLDTLVPPQNRRLGQWGTVSLKDATKSTDVTKPSDTYPDMVPALYMTDGAPSFGMFDAVELAKKGKPAMHQDGLREIRISIADNGRGQNEDGNEGGGDPTKLVLTLKTAAGETQFTGDKLLALPREPMPGGQGESKGWKLGAVLAAAGVTTFEKLLLTDAAGTNLPLDKADFDDKTSVPFVKLNKQGKLRFRVYKKKGDGWEASSDLRALTTIQVVK